MMRYSSSLACGVAMLCALVQAAPSGVSRPVTFNKDIAPILYGNCTSCHRPGEAAPFALLTYADATKRGQLIAAVTQSHYMPPWKAQPASFGYRDERRLTDSQIALIQDWVRQGMPEGAAADRPKPPEFSSGWQLGEPDLIVEMPAAFHVPADGPDIYRNIAVPLGMAEDKWITAIDMRLNAPAVVHHVLYFADPSGKAHQHAPEGAEPGFSGMSAGEGVTPIGGWAVGAQPHRFPAGLALQIKAGSDLLIQYHFHPDGKPEAERAKIGLYFAKEAPERRFISIQMPPVYSLFAGLKIPAGEKDFVVRDSYTLPADIDAVSVGAHAHYLARRMVMTATLPSGEVQNLLTIGDWDFAWQDRYFFRDFVALPRGTRIDAEIHWDNSSANARNPSSPPVPVEWGEQSKDEMGSVSLLAVPHVQSDWSLLYADLRRHREQAVRSGLAKDPKLLLKIQTLLRQ